MLDRYEKNNTMNLIGHTKVGVDTMVFIYLFERHPKYLPVVRQLFDELETKHITPVCSSIILTEILQLPLRQHDHLLVKQYQEILIAQSTIMFVSATVSIATQAAVLAAQYNLKTIDAIHLASALDAGATAFITVDKAFAKIKELETIILHA